MPLDCVPVRFSDRLARPLPTLDSPLLTAQIVAWPVAQVKWAGEQGRRDKGQVTGDISEPGEERPQDDIGRLIRLSVRPLVCGTTLRREGFQQNLGIRAGEHETGVGDCNDL